MQWGSDDPEAVCGMSTATMINRDAFVKAIVLQFQTIFFLISGTQWFSHWNIYFIKNRFLVSYRLAIHLVLMVLPCSVSL